MANKTIDPKVAKERAAKKTEIQKPTGARPIGKTTKLGVQAAWIYVLQQNEKVPAKERLTDEQITKFMKREFPGRQTKVFDAVQAARNKLNKGGFGEQSFVSQRYDADGKAVEVKRGRAASAKPKVAAKLKKTKKVLIRKRIPK